MEKAYIVTSGDYSDYSIERVFSTREMAEDFCDRHDDSYRVEEYCVDEDLPPRETQVFKVYISISKGEASVEGTAGARLAGLFMADFHSSRLVVDHVIYWIASDSKKRAIKVASEMHAQVLANELMKYPYMRITIVKFHGQYITPIYDYRTGEIVLAEGRILGEMAPAGIRTRNNYQAYERDPE